MIAEQAAGAGAGDPTDRIDLDSSHQRQVNYQRVVPRSVAGNIVTVAANGDRQRAAEGEPDGVGNISRGRRTDDEMGIALVDAVPNAARGIVAVVIGRDDLRVVAQPGLEIGERGGLERFSDGAQPLR